MAAVHRGSSEFETVGTMQTLKNRVQQLRGQTPTEEKSALIDESTGSYIKDKKAQAPGSTKNLLASADMKSRVSPRHAFVEQSLQLAYAQIKLSLAFFAIVSLTSRVSMLKPWVEPFIELQYISEPNKAHIGIKDAYFVLTSVFVVVFARAVVMVVSMRWVAPRIGILGTGKAVVRFAEQGWTLVYCSVIWVLGMVLLNVGGYTWRDPAKLWQGFPHVFIDIRIKAYYLFVLGFWLSQLYVINVEERRKDHYQMFTHHIVTCCLIVGSYLNYYTRIGHIIMLLMDIGDIQLSLAKVLKYMGYERACDVAFLAFLVGWIVCRHVLYSWHLWYAWMEAPQHFVPGCAYDSNGAVLACYSKNAHDTLAFLLIVLEGIIYVWLYMIIRVVIKVVKGENAEDTRSDDED